MPKDNASYRVLPYTRREWMRNVAVAGAAGGLAGCLGDDGDDGEDGTDTETDDGMSGPGETGTETEEAVQEHLDEYFTLPAIFNLAEANFNGWADSTQLFYPIRLLWDGLAYYSAQGNNHHPLLADDWTFDMDGGTITFELNENFEWHDGTSYTAQHAVDHFKLARVRQFPPWGAERDGANDVYVEDEYTFAFDVESQPQSLIEGDFLGTTWWHWLWTHPDLHAEYIDRAEDATTEEELTQLSTDLGQYEITPEEAMEAGIGTGPVELTEAHEDELVLEPYDGYPVGEVGGRDEPMELNWNGFTVEDFGEGESAFHQAAIADNIDGFTGDTSESVRNEMGDHWGMLPNPSTVHQSLIFSPDSMWGQDDEESRALRQAVAYFYDPNQFVQLLGEDISRLPDPNNVTGLGGPQDESFLGDSLDQFTNYGNSETGWVQEEDAEAKMEEAGFEQDGGEWVDDSGSQLTVEISYNLGWDANIPAYENVAEQFRQFGIAVEQNGQESTAIQNETLANHDFEIAIYNHCFGPHALHSYQNSIGTLSANLPEGDVYTNELEEVTVPMGVGDEDGNLETVNINDRITEGLNADSDDTVLEKVEELAWIWNQWVPSIQVNTGVRMNYAATDNWQWAIADDDDRLNAEQPWTYLSRTGHLRGDPR